MHQTRQWIYDLFSPDPPGTCLFRVDAGNRPGLSFGHLQRCITLSGILKDLFHTTSVFLMKDIEEGVLYAQKKGCRVISFPEHSNEKDEIGRIDRLAYETAADLFFLDLPDPRLDQKAFKSMRKTNIRTVLIDDFRFQNPGADMVFNSSILAMEKFSPADLSDKKTTFILGPEYFIFDEALLKDEVHFDPAFKNIVISFGGADPKNLTQRMAGLLVNRFSGAGRPEPGQTETNALSGCRFHIVLGPGYKGENEISNLISEQTDRIFIIRAPDNIIPYFKAADLVICAGGRTVYELSLLKKEFLPIGSTEFEAATIAAFIRHNIIGHGLLAWDEEEFNDIFRKAFQAQK